MAGIKKSTEAFRVDPAATAAFSALRSALPNLRPLDEDARALKAVVIGGGNVWRGRRGAAMRMGTVAADQMGMLALYNLIGINQKEDQPMCIGTVKTMLDKAMERAQSGLFKRSKKRVDRDGYTVLFEKDFS